ncbi:putative sensory box protein [Megalodesulfovibrio gigas DSM 1382 = ATCC 19364]|uniref:Putative sensory box protein n=2 Tax=Megalodesulfovibrio gigas TaxID=879 RepID=T2G7Y8_MEGG1|nr:putative sensory box protein [Megalodesulfovibrio gigas DSM 1382 = ATCC 19364]
MSNHIDTCRNTFCTWLEASMFKTPQLSAVCNTLQEGLVLIGADGRIQAVNPAMEKLTGYTAGELIGQPCTILQCDVCEKSRREGRDHWCRLFDTRQEHRRRCRILRKDGASVPVLKNASLVMEGEQVLVAVETLTDLTELDLRDRKIEELTRRVEEAPGFHGLVGMSAPMRRLFKSIERAAGSDAPVLILGESGTGKELVAHALHALGARRDGPFIQLNCAALNESLLESELFGHVKGAFTGAVRHRQGRFEAAHGGDLFLDEIGDIPVPMQVKLLRVLETKEVERVGDNRPMPVDVRFISATNRNIPALVAEGTYREDFYYRINVLPLHVPPLRDRLEDIPLLAEHFLHTIAARSGRCAFSLDRPALEALLRHPWPGNVRELKSALEFAAIHAEAETDGRIEVCHLPATVQGQALCPPPQTAATRHADDGLSADEHAEKNALIAALQEAGGNKNAAARLLGVHRGTILNRMRKYGVDVQKSVAANAANNSTNMVKSR